MSNKLLQSIALLCCLLIGLSACSRKWAVIGAAAAATGAGAYYYVKGDLKRTYDAPLDKTLDATVQALNELQMNVDSKQHDAFSGVIKGTLADGKSYTVNLKRLAENSTEVGIRIGTFGDRERSEAIHSKILSLL